MRQYLVELEQTALMRDLNASVQSELDGVHYATMVAVGFHSRRGLLVLTNAGHPPPLWYRSRTAEWKWVEPKRGARPATIEGVPLGLLPGASYDRTVLKPETGDLVVLYSDGVSEALNEEGLEIGREGLLAMAQQVDTRNAQACGSGLAAALRAFRGASLAEDDETLIVLQRRESAI